MYSDVNTYAAVFCTAVRFSIYENESYFGEKHIINQQDATLAVLCLLTLRLLILYIYGAPSKARNANVVYMDLRLATLKQSLSICCTMFQH